MSREIKFRSWDKVIDNMHYDGNLLNGDVMVINVEGGLQISSGEYCHRKDDFVLMQYTGLKDRNGKEIYEGDVIRTEIAGDTYHDVAEWSEENGGWIFESLQGAAGVQWSDVEHGKPEVIGNIYENPKLLDLAQSAIETNE